MKKYVNARRITVLMLVFMLILGSIPLSVFAISPVESPIISTDEETNTFKSNMHRTGLTNQIQIDMSDTGNYEINECVTLSDGYLYLGIDNTTGNELVRKISFDGTLKWQNKNFFDLDGTTQIRGAVEVNERLFVVGYVKSTGFICELDRQDGSLVPDSTVTFNGRANGAVSDGEDCIFIAGSLGLYTYKISDHSIINPISQRYINSIAYVPEDNSVIAVCNNILLRYTISSEGEPLIETTFYSPAAGDAIWAVWYINGFLYATGQEGSYYIRKLSLDGTELGRFQLISSISDTTDPDYQTFGAFSNASGAFFDAVSNKIYFISISNYRIKPIPYRIQAFHTAPNI